TRRDIEAPSSSEQLNLFFQIILVARLSARQNHKADHRCRRIHSHENLLRECVPSHLGFGETSSPSPRCLRVARRLGSVDCLGHLPSGEGLRRRTPRSAARPAPGSLEVPESKVAGRVCCSGRFGATRYQVYPTTRTPESSCWTGNCPTAASAST